MKLLLINHNSIQIDPNLLKWLRLYDNEGIDYRAIGIFDNESANRYQSDRIRNLSLSSKKISRKFGILRKLIIFLQWKFLVRREIKAFKPEIIQTANHLALFSLPFFLRSKFKLVYDVNELESEMNGMSKLRSKTIKLFERMFWARLDAVFFSNESFKSFYFSSYGEKKIIENIYGTPDIERVYSIKESEYLRNKYDIPIDHKIYVLSGFISEGRNLDLILNIFNSIDFAHLVLIGFKLNDSILSIIEDSGNVHYHEFVSQKELISILNSADVGLCLIENTSLSYYLSSPQKFWEYHFAGIEVICSNYPEMVRLTNAIGRGIAINNNEDELRKAIYFYKGGIINNCEVNLSDFYWKNQSKKIVAIYNLILGINL